MATDSVPPAWLDFHRHDPVVVNTLLDVLIERAERMNG